jgi:O-antigen ligase
VKKVEKIFAILSVFLIPTQLALHFWPASAFIFGIRIDYLSPTIYLTDLIIFLLMGLWIINDKKSIGKSIKKTSLKIVIPVLFFVILNILFSTSVWVTVFKWLRISEMFLFVLYIKNRKETLEKDVLYSVLFFSGFIFSLIGISQFILGRTTGLFYFLGERTFSVATPAIALFQFNGEIFLRAYSTFPHPNAFAGFLGILTIIYFGSEKIKRTWFTYIETLFIFLAMFLTFSISAYLAIIFVALLFVRKKSGGLALVAVKIFFWFSVLSSLLLPVFSKELFGNNQGFKTTITKNISERIDLSMISGKMISEKFLTGEGLNTFIVNIPKFSRGFSYTWLLQPVHNIYLLVLTETGIVGLLFFCFGIFKLLTHLVKNEKTTNLAIILFVLFTGLTDHYWLTIQQNLLTVSLLFGLLL